MIWKEHRYIQPNGDCGGSFHIDGWFCCFFARFSLHRLFVGIKNVVGAIRIRIHVQILHNFSWNTFRRTLFTSCSLVNTWHSLNLFQHCSSCLGFVVLLVCFSVFTTRLIFLFHFVFTYRITCLYLPVASKWLYVGTDKGNIHVINIESFSLSGYIINWNKAIEV